MNYEKAVSNIRSELKTYIQKNNIKSLVLGISGGMDSCLCAALAKPVCDELKIPLIGRSLPISTNAPDEIERAKLTGKVFCTDFEQENLGEIYNMFKIINPLPQNIYEMIAGNPPRMDLTKECEEEQKQWKIRNGNIKARLRMIYLYNLASMNKGMVLSTDNYTEYLLGFWTLHGDEGDFGMIQELWKSEVYDMAEWIKDNECKFLDEQEAIESTIDALATDGLGVTNMGDLGQIMPDFIGTSRKGYREVDEILKKLETISIRNPQHELDSHPVIKRHLNSNFKRNNPVNIPRNLIIK